MGNRDAGIALEPTLFQVSFGPEEALLQNWNVRSVSAIDGPSASSPTDIQASIDAGLDVALLELALPAPTDVIFPAVKLDYQPSTGDQYTLVGFGISSAQTGASGVKRAATDQLSGFDPPTGRIETHGNGACLGDSGGPLLFGASDQLVGVISVVGTTSDGGYCVTGITQSTSVANPAVREFLRPAVEGPDAALADAALADAALDATPPDASRDAGSGGRAGDAQSAQDDASNQRDRIRASGGCALRPPPGIGGFFLVAVLVMWCIARRRGSALASSKMNSS
jgi:hypothetical protein